jgi:hypothetical protein
MDAKPGKTTFPTIALRLCLGIAAIGGLCFLYACDPATPGTLPACPVHASTGLYCPGCGSMRATHKILHGELLAACKLNPLMVASIPVLLVLVAFRRIAYHPWTPWIVFIVVVAYAIIRNIPCSPWNYLAPH